jgi:penicillin-binding protein 1C
VGLADFHRTGPGTTARTAVRSGRPQAYALASIRASSRKLLLPSDLAGATAENFDKHCSGRSNLEQTLAYSLNIPAVRVLQDLGDAHLPRNRSSGRAFIA